jgi:hypothetical protein
VGVEKECGAAVRLRAQLKGDVKALVAHGNAIDIKGVRYGPGYRDPDGQPQPGAKRSRPAPLVAKFPGDRDEISAGQHGVVGQVLGGIGFHGQQPVHIGGQPDVPENILIDAIGETAVAFRFDRPGHRGEQGVDPARRCSGNAGDLDGPRLTAQRSVFGVLHLAKDFDHAPDQPGLIGALTGAAADGQGKTRGVGFSCYGYRTR